MKKIGVLLIIAFLFGKFLSAQNKSAFARTYVDTLPDRFHLDVNKLRNNIFDKVPVHYRNSLYPRKTYRYADLSSIQISNLFTSGYVYNDWPFLEDYLNKVLEKIIPEGLKGNEYIKIYLVKNGDFNAYMTPSGMIFLNIGIFADVENEATLASIIAHELAHYYLNHSIESYVKNERGDFEPKLFYKNKGAYSKYSVKTESDADSLAFEWIAKSGYSTSGLLDAFRISERHEKKLLAQISDIWELPEITHPVSEKRLLNFRRYMGESGTLEGEKFIVSKNGFFEFRKQAKTEILKYLLLRFNYYDCIEKAFTFHLFDVENPEYVYYIMEAIRRAGYLDNLLWSKKFITCNYYRDTIVDHRRKKIPFEFDLFESFPNVMLGLDSSAYEKIQGKFYWEGDKKFITYDEAFRFFAEVGKLYQNPECTLSYALAVFPNKEVSGPLLESYLKNENIKYRDYAQSLLKGNLSKGLNNQKMTVLNDFIVIVRQGKEEIPVSDNRSGSKDYVKKIINSLNSDFPNRTFEYLPELKYGRMQDYLILSEVEQFSLSPLLAFGTQALLFRLDPRYWQLMKRLNVNEIEFVNCQYYDVRKKQSRLESYKEIATTTYEDLFSETKRYRYLDIILSSVRGIEDVRMKTLYYGGEDELDYKKSAFDQIVEILKNKIDHKDDLMAEEDELLRKIRE